MATQGGDGLTQFNVRDPRGAWPGRQPGQGEKELEKMGLGARFWIPTDEDRARIQRYVDAEQLMDPAEHYKLYSNLGPSITPPDEEQWLAIDWPGMLARLMRHYILGPGFAVKARVPATAPEVQRIFEDSKMQPLLRQVSEALPVFGDAVLRVDVEASVVETESGETLPLGTAKFIHPGNYFPRFSATDPTKPVEVTLAWIFSQPDSVRATEGGSAMPFLVLKEIHTPGTVRYELNDWDGNRQGGARELSLIDEGLVAKASTGLLEIPVVHLGYNVAGGMHFGRSEFARIQRIFLALENRLSQLDEILDRHARPKLVVGPGILDENARANLADFDVIEIDPSVMEKAVSPKYLTWDPQQSAIQHEIDKLEEYFFITTETSPASFGLERDGSQVESARALRFKAHRTINKVEDVRDPLRCMVQDVFRLAQNLENKAREEDGIPQYTTSRVDVLFPDPIIEDNTQEAQDYALLKQAGLVSRERAVADLYDLTPAGAEVEVQEILQDMTDEAATTPALGPPAEDALGLDLELDDEQDEGEAGVPVPGTPADAPGLGIAQDIQKSLLNGAQVSSMVAVVTNVAAGALPRDAGLAILETAFGLSAEEAKEIMGDAGLEDEGEEIPVVEEIPEEV